VFVVVFVATVVIPLVGLFIVATGDHGATAPPPGPPQPEPPPSGSGGLGAATALITAIGTALAAIISALAGLVTALAAYRKARPAMAGHQEPSGSEVPKLWTPGSDSR
jgi:hypothetical protein